MDLTTISIAIICLLIGLFVGVLLTRALSPQEQKRRELEEKLQAKEDELKIYQRDVSDHFLKTSGLLTELRRSQREIIEQLATSAMRLTSPEVSRQIQNDVFSELGSEARINILSAVQQEAPKDYAPSVPGGVLSESYGLTDIREPGVTRGISDTKTSSAEDESNDDPTFKIS